MRDLRHPLTRVHGLGSAKKGVKHWWLQRLTAVLLIPLGGWFILFILKASTLEYQAIIDHLQSPIRSIAILTMLLVLYYHAVLGMQVVIEDYIVIKWLKITLIILIQFLALIAVLSASLALLSIYIGR